MRRLASLLLTAGVLFADEVEDLVEQLCEAERCLAAEDELVRLGEAAVPALIKNYRIGERALLRIGAPAALPLAQALPHADADDRYWLIRILGQLGPVARDAVPALRRELEGPWPRVAALEVTRITPDATWAIPTMVDGLERFGENPETFDALARLGPRAKAAVPILRKHGRGDGLWRGSALRALWWIEGDAERLLPDLRALLATPHADDAATVLGLLGGAARPAIPELLRVLKSPPKRQVWFDRDEALTALLEIGLQPEHARAVRPWLESEDNTLCAYGICLLGSVRPFSKEWVADFSELLFDESLAVRRTAAIWLGRIDEPAAIPALLRGCMSANQEVAANSARALGNYGKRPMSVAALRQVVRQREGWHRWHAAWVLGELGATSAVEDLEAALKDPQFPPLRRAAADALGKLEARSAVPSLETCLSDKPAVAAGAALALYRITGKMHVVPLRKALEQLPGHTLEVLAELGTAARPLLPEIKALRNHRRAQVAAEAVFTTYGIEGDAEDAVRRLIHLAAIELHPFGAEAAIFALGRMGSAARPAKPFLVSRLRTASKLSDIGTVRAALYRIDGR